MSHWYDTGSLLKKADAALASKRRDDGEDNTDHELDDVDAKVLIDHGTEANACPGQ